MVHSVIDYLKYASERYGDKTAYNDTKNTISFREAEISASRIASALLDRRLFQKPVLVLAERSVLTPAAFLGTAMAGCFYIPVDASLNTHRMDQIILASGADLLLTNTSLLPLAGQLEYEGEVLTIEKALETDINAPALADAEKKMHCQMPLYVIFTSGSSGKPKGVCTSHLSLINYIEAVDEVLQLQENDVLGNQSPLDYIAAIRDIYLPLKTGAETVIIPSGQFAMAAELAETLNTYKVSVLCWSAAGLEVGAKTGLLDEIGEKQEKHIRKVLFSGSVLPGRVLAAWQRCFPEAQFINQYGPTEATASCTYHIVEGEASEDTVLPIGIPYRNYGILLLKGDGTETSRGEVGEICVTGPGVTLGYYGDPELTAGSFIQNPLNSTYREIIYKTGDLGKYNEDGLLLFCGRKDRQIKHLGHRIELEEIELAAGGIDGIEECAAVYNEAKKALCLVYAGSADKKSIVLHFRESMPAFMVPRKVIKVEELPHLPNGKTDLKAVSEFV